MVSVPGDLAWPSADHVRAALRLVVDEEVLSDLFDPDSICTLSHMGLVQMAWENLHLEAYVHVALIGLSDMSAMTEEAPPLLPSLASLYWEECSLPLTKAVEAVWPT